MKRMLKGDLWLICILVYCLKFSQRSSVHILIMLLDQLFRIISSFQI